MSNLADMTMFILGEFGEYIEGNDNPVDTAMKIMKDLKAESEKLRAENKKLREQIRC